MVQTETRCHRCGAEYDAWFRLPFVEHVGAANIWAIVTSWDAKQRVEVRQCLACGARLARLVHETGQWPR